MTNAYMHSIITTYPFQESQAPHRRRTAGMAPPNLERGRDGGAAAVAGINKQRGCAVFIRNATAGLGDSGNGGFATTTTTNFASRLALNRVLALVATLLACSAAREFSDADLEAQA